MRHLSKISAFPSDYDFLIAPSQSTSYNLPQDRPFTNRMTEEEHGPESPLNLSQTQFDQVMNRFDELSTRLATFETQVNAGFDELSAKIVTVETQVNGGAVASQEDLVKENGRLNGDEGWAAKWVPKAVSHFALAPLQEKVLKILVSPCNLKGGGGKKLKIDSEQFILIREAYNELWTAITRNGRERSLWILAPRNAGKTSAAAATAHHFVVMDEELFTTVLIFEGGSRIMRVTRLK
jgi:hypothetical protein